MLRLLRNKKGQNTAEYAIVIGLVVAAAIAMQTYIKRGIQAKVKDGTDLLTAVTGDTGGGSLATTGQYEPYYMQTSFDVTRGTQSVENTGAGGDVTRTLNREDTSRTGTQTITAAQ
jgi:Flp pilus assembly pilin Flp